MIDLTNLELYTQRRASWQTVMLETNEALASYYGGSMLEGYVTRFGTNEEEGKYQWRRRVTVKNYDNFPKEISGTYIEGIVRSGDITRKAGTDASFNDFLGGRWYKNFVSNELMPMSLILPELFIEICVPSVNNGQEIKSKADEIENDLYPYPALCYPHYVLNYECDKDGKLCWICIAKATPTVQKDGNDNIVSVDFGGGMYIYDETNIYDVDLIAGDGDATVAEVKTKDPHGFSQVPFVRILWQENKSAPGSPKPGHAFMYDIIQKSMAAMMWKSMLLEAGYFHLFPKLVMDEDTFANVQKDGGMGASKVIRKSNTGEAGAGESVYYLTMPGSEFEALKSLCYENVPEEIYRTARLRDRSTTKQQSGVAKMFDMVPELGVLTKIAELFNNIEEDILTIMASRWYQKKANFLQKLLKNKKNPDIEVQYPETFDIKSTAEVVKETTDFYVGMEESGLPVSETGARIASREAHRAMFPNATDDELNLMYKEINALPLDALMQRLKAPAPIPPTDLGKKQPVMIS